MTEMRSVDAIFLESFEETNFKMQPEFPAKFLVNLADNLGVFYRDYQEQYPRLMPLLATVVQRE